MSRTYRLRHWKYGPAKVKKYVDPGLWVRMRQQERVLCWLRGSKYEPPLSVSNIGYSGITGWGSLACVPSRIKKASRAQVHRGLRHKERELLKELDNDWDSVIWESRSRWLSNEEWNLT